jgi:hypothetical protein
MIIEKTPIIDTKRTKNGWRYPISIIETMKEVIDSAQPHEKFGEFGFPKAHVIDVKNVAFTYDNPIIEDDTLYVDITVLDTPKGEELKKKVKKVSFVPVGLGTLNENKDMETYEFLSIAAIKQK